MAAAARRLRALGCPEPLSTESIGKPSLVTVWEQLTARSGRDAPCPCGGSALGRLHALPGAFRARLPRHVLPLLVHDGRRRTSVFRPLRLGASAQPRGDAGARCRGARGLPPAEYESGFPAAARARGRRSGGARLGIQHARQGPQPRCAARAHPGRHHVTSASYLRLRCLGVTPCMEFEFSAALCAELGLTGLRRTVTSTGYSVTSNSKGGPRPPTTESEFFTYRIFCEILLYFVAHNVIKCIAFSAPEVRGRAPCSFSYSLHSPTQRAQNL